MDSQETPNIDVAFVTHSPEVAALEDIQNDIHNNAETSDQVTSNIEDFNEYWNTYMNGVGNLKQLAEQNWENDNFRKAFTKFAPKFEKTTAANVNTVTRHLHNFGSDPRSNTSISGIKRKTGFHIPVQPSALSRRKRYSVGRSTASAGRRAKPLPKTVLFIDDSHYDSGSSYHAGPPAKKKRLNRNEHNLNKAITENRPNAKKH